MSYFSIKKNNLKTFFCSNCDELLNKGAFSIVKDSKQQILCQKCYGCSQLTNEEQKKVKTKESHQEISECLEVIEGTVRFTRNPQPILKQQQQQQQQQQQEIQLICEICEKEKAEFYCLNDEMMFCFECFEQEHQTKSAKKHNSKTIEQWNKENKENISKRKENNEKVEKEKEKEKEKYFCVEHKSTEPIFCVDDSQMFCSGCSINEHTNHRMKSIESQSKEEKQRINLEQSFKEFERLFLFFSWLGLRLELGLVWVAVG